MRRRPLLIEHQRSKESRNNFLAQKTKATKVSHATLLALITLLFVIMILVIAVTSGAGRQWEISVVVGFAVNGLLAGSFLVNEAMRRPFSLIQIHWIFYITFFVVAPLSQYIHGSVLWDYTISDELYMQTNILLLIWALVFGLCSLTKDNEAVRSDFKGFHQDFYSKLPAVTKKGVLAALVLSAGATVILVIMVGFWDLFSRSTYDLGLENSSVSLVVDKVLRGLPVMCFIVALVRYKQKRDFLGVLLILGALLLVADFPLGMPRFNAAMVYGGIILLVFPMFMEKRGFFALIFLLLLIVVFPAANVFRREEFDIILLLDSFVSTIGGIPQGFTTVDFDAYSMLARGIDYVSTAGLSWGYQLLSALLFFVPRSIWLDKPFGSGQTVAEYQGQTYTNLSFPLPAEGYINFGVVGLMLFAFLFVSICKKCDSSFWYGTPKRWMPFYSLACFEFFFMLRGDLMSSTAYLLGFILVYWLVSTVAFQLPVRKALYHSFNRVVNNANKKV